MKRIYLTLLVAIFATAGIFAQAPQGINYQTVIRDGDGNILADTELSLQMNVRSAAPDGEIGYSETHNVSTNAFGLVNLVIGNGSPQTGTFSEINWGGGDKYLETAIDLNGGSDFTVMGVTQFLSVPYAHYASNGVQSMSLVERDALESPAVGMQIYTTTTNCLNYFSGISWFETCGDCTPMPTIANAGSDQYYDDETVTTNLEGNTPEYSIGTWSVVSGEGGIFEDVNEPATLFTGEVCEEYTLTWTFANPCGTTSDIVNIEFDTQPTVADAGDDQQFLDNTICTTLAANTPTMGEGLWSIQSGQGGLFADAANAATEFTGITCETYTLRWTITTPCHESFDAVEIDFDNTPTVADAGNDQGDLQGTSTTLEANSPLNGLGYWSIVSGTGGTIQIPTNPNSVFIGQQGGLYELKWTISTECNSSYDNVIIYFGELFQCGLPLVDARDGQTYETVLIDGQCWMAENLAYLPDVSPSSEGNNTDPYYYVYAYEGTDVAEAKASDNYQNYGALYNWPASLTSCPTGWHLPTDAEWYVLTDYLGGTSVAGGKMKSTRTEPDPHPRWNSPNTGATNSSGFSGLPGGYRYTDGSFDNLGEKRYFWSSTGQYSLAWFLYLDYGSDDANNYTNTKGFGFSVRCLRDL